MRPIAYLLKFLLDFLIKDSFDKTSQLVCYFCSLCLQLHCIFSSYKFAEMLYNYVLSKSNQNFHISSKYRYYRKIIKLKTTVVNNVRSSELDNNGCMRRHLICIHLTSSWIRVQNSTQGLINIRSCE